MHPPESLNTENGLATLIADHLLSYNSTNTYEVSGKFISGKFPANENFSFCIRINTDIPMGNNYPNHTVNFVAGNEFLKHQDFHLVDTDGCKNGNLGNMNCEFRIFKDYRIKRENYAGETDDVTKKLEPQALSELVDSLEKLIDCKKLKQLKLKFPSDKPRGFFGRLNAKLRSIFGA